METEAMITADQEPSNARVLEQFGADTQLWRPSTQTYAFASDILANKVVVLYFSAQWCGPCRRFTPLLKSIYDNLRSEPNSYSKEPFEIVYCSMDNFSSEYESYTAQMPWWCLPLKSPVVDKLRTFYKTEGIPHLCVIDREGSLLCGDAVNEAMEDTSGARFPWRCPKSIEEILPDTYVRNDGTYHPTADLDSKYLILYFGAKWCPRCSVLTKKVARAYRALKRIRDDFEILFVSSDRDRRQFKENHSQMPFGAIPFGDRYARNKLAHFLGIRGIPSIMIFGPQTGGRDNNGEHDDNNNNNNRPLINPNIRDVFERGDHLREFPYLPETFGDINRVTDDINGSRFVIVFHEAGDDQEQDEIRDALQSASQALSDHHLLLQHHHPHITTTAGLSSVGAFSSSSGKPIKLCWAFRFSGLCQSLRSVLRLGQPKDTPTMVLLDIPDSGAFYLSNQTDITSDNILAFIKSPGQRQQI